MAVKSSEQMATWTGVCLYPNRVLVVQPCVLWIAACGAHLPFSVLWLRRLVRSGWERRIEAGEREDLQTSPAGRKEWEWMVGSPSAKNGAGARASSGAGGGGHRKKPQGREGGWCAAGRVGVRAWSGARSDEITTSMASSEMFLTVKATRLGSRA